ncbi:MAG: hypothetical protein ACI837_000274 [Crocinitomicaceae bacterium]|jgi:hypothetical protein
MKMIFPFLIFCLLAFEANSQEVTPFIDFSGYFKSFQNGFFRQVEFQPIKSFKTGDDLVAYIDFKGNLRVFDGSQPQDLANLAVEYEVSDHLLVWKIGTTLNLWDDGDLQTLSYYANSYALRDSLVVYQDTRSSSLMVYYDGENYELMRSTGVSPMPSHVGENIVVFRDNGNYYKVFWQGEIYDLDVWHNPIPFNVGTDILAFNDPITGTFAIFEKGQFLDVEDFHMNAYKAGRGFIAYENRNGELIYYGNGKKKKLTNFAPSFWDVKDDVVIWGENGVTSAHVNNVTIELARFIPKDYLVKNDVVAFRNAMGGVDALLDGKVKMLTNQTSGEYSIHGSTVLVRLFNSSYILFREGRQFRN